MATVISHALVGAALGQSIKPGWRKEWRFWCVAALCSLLPDIDAIGFSLGIHYGDTWGHRGFTHSILFAAIVGIALGSFFGDSWSERSRRAMLLFGIMASHGILDALTNGGLGVAFFSPFDLHRYFFWWRPIRVSPIGTHAFLSGRGIRVLKSEIYWIWIPMLSLAGFLCIRRRNKKGTTHSAEE
jgi:inner membrane protein